jgi:hypothetical protein
MCITISPAYLIQWLYGGTTMSPSWPTINTLNKGGKTFGSITP